jgi:repressor LexA
MQGLTKRQEMVLDYITRSITDRGYPPTLREIGSHMGIRSTNGVNDHLRALERKGYLKREDMKSRALRPVNMDPNSNSELADVPVVGQITAGKPVLSPHNILDTVSIDRDLVGDHPELFALTVKSDSMKNAGIEKGDTVFVRKQLHANPNDIAVVAIGDDASIRYYQPEREFIRLQPANTAYAPIVIRKEDFRPTQILGVVVGLYRRFERP